MEDADSDSGFDSDGDWYHAGRDIVYGLRTDSYAVGPRRRRKREAPGGDASLFCRQVQKQASFHSNSAILSIKKIVNGYLREECVRVFITTHWCSTDESRMECLRWHHLF